MLQVTGSPTWRTVVGGSATYVDALAARLPDVRRGCRGHRGDPARRRGRRAHRRRPGRALRPGRRRHPRRPGAEPARRRRPSGEGRPRRDHLLGQRDLAAPGLLGAAPPPRGPRVLELPDALRPAGRRRDRELLDEPAAGPRGRRRLRRDPQPRRPRRPGVGHRPDDATPTRSSPARRWRPRSGCAPPAETGSRSPAPTSAGASTRTAAAPASRPPRRSGPSGDRASLPRRCRALVVGTVSHTRRTPARHALHAIATTSGWSTSTPCRGCPGRPGCWPASTPATTSTGAAWAAASGATSSGSWRAAACGSTRPTGS